MTKNQIANLLIAEAEKWIEVRENGFNKGVEVEMFQKAVDGKAQGEPWCMAFSQFVVKQVCTLLGVENPLPQVAGEHCMSVWSGTPGVYRNQEGGRGHMPIWNKKGTSSGHTGLSVDQGKFYFNTIEGNTNKAGSREGDGVYRKKRAMTSPGSLQLKGFIDLPLMIWNSLPSHKKTV